MFDSYVELIVKRKTLITEQILKGLLITITVIAFILGLGNPIILVVAIGL